MMSHFQKVSLYLIRLCTHRIPVNPNISCTEMLYVVVPMARSSLLRKKSSFSHESWKFTQLVLHLSLWN